MGGISRGRPGGYPGGRPGPKTFTPSAGAQENKVFRAAEGADVHDPRGSPKNFMQENFGLIFRSLQERLKSDFRGLLYSDSKVPLGGYF